MAYHFKQLSLVSPLANAFILPAQPAVMVLGGLAVLLSFVLYPLGQVAAWVAWVPTAYTIRMVEFFNTWPHRVIYLGGFSLTLVVLFYVLLFGVTLAGGRLREWLGLLRQRFRFLSLSAALLALLICALFAWRLVAAAPDGRLHVTFLSVGSADAVLIQTPSGRHVLIDGGPSAASASDALGRRLSPLDHSLDWLVLASTDENEVAALPRLLPRFPPRQVLLAGPTQASYSAGVVMQWLVDEGIPVTQAEEGQSLDLGDGARLQVLFLSPRGATLVLEWNLFRLMLPIGANADTVVQLENSDLVDPMNVLLLSQSGYAPLTRPALLDNLNPQLVVISVAVADQDGLPDQETLDLLKGYSVLRTDLNGWIEVSTDGKQMWVSSERLPPTVGAQAPVASREPNPLPSTTAPPPGQPAATAIRPGVNQPLEVNSATPSAANQPPAASTLPPATANQPGRATGPAPGGVNQP